jgi:hypothetical protein
MCSDEILYISTEDQLSLSHLNCERAKTAVVQDHRTLLFTLLEVLDYEAVVIDSLSAVVRHLHPELGSKISAFISWLMHERGRFGITVAQVSGKSKRAPYHEFIEPWADYVIRVKRLRGDKRVAIMECPEVKEQCFEITGGGVKWTEC